MWTSVSTLFALLMVLGMSVDASDSERNGCNIELYAEKVGCFESNTKSNQPVLTEQLVNARSRESKAYGGFLINWFKWKQSINKLLCRCVEKAKTKGYRYVGLNSYAECSSGPNSGDYALPGPSRNCLQELFKPCDKSNRDHACMGGMRTNYIFKVKQQSHSEGHEKPDEKKVGPDSSGKKGGDKKGGNANSGKESGHKSGGSRKSGHASGRGKGHGKGRKTGHGKKSHKMSHGRSRPRGSTK